MVQRADGHSPDLASERFLTPFGMTRWVGGQAMRNDNYYVYTMCSISRVIYVGVTNELDRRVSEHKSGDGSVFTSRYRCSKLVWYERFGDVRQAIECEKRIKGWSRSKKVAPIEAENPNWMDLSDV